MQRQTTRDAILQAARELFARKGFANTAVREICQAAGVTPPVIYYHFGSKEGLFAAVVEDTLTLDGFHALLQEQVAAHTDPWAKLRTYVYTYLTRFPTHLLNPGLHLETSTQLHDVSLRRISAGIEALYQLARDILLAGVAAGAFRALDVDTAAACLMGTVDSFVRAQVFLGVEFDPEQLTEHIVDLYRRGLAADG